MPLYKRKPFLLLEPPQDLDPNELVFQVRFTKEVFRDYQEYLSRLNLYRQRIWTCKVTGKSNLTYEEALVSEHCAVDKVQRFPKELIAPVLRMVQYSKLCLKDIVDMIHAKLQEILMVGIEIHGMKEGSVHQCKILQILNDADIPKYKVGWLDKSKSVIGNSVVNEEDLIRKRPPLSRSILKAFIRESTMMSCPWVVREELAEKYGVSCEPPDNLSDELFLDNGHLRKDKANKKEMEKTTLRTEAVLCGKKRKYNDGKLDGFLTYKRKMKKEEELIVEPIRYPIDDLLVKPSSDDPNFLDRPPLCRDFKVPMQCVGDLLMVWSFLSSFSRILNLWPFSLEDFENAICHTESDLSLIVESHSALLRLLIKERGDYFMSIQHKKRKSKIKSVNWAEYLCDFLEVKDKLESLSHITIIKRGHYGLLDVNAKLVIIRELVEEVLLTETFREKLNEFIDKHQAFLTSKREETKKQKEQDNKNKDNHNHCQENGNGMFHNLGNNEKKSNGVASNVFGKAWKFSKGSCDGKTMSKRRRKDNHNDLQSSQGTQNELLSRAICNSLGKDRSYNRYWFFRREGKLFVESSDAKQWGYYSTFEELDALLGSLNPKGERERALKRQLEKSYDRISVTLQRRRSKDVSHRSLVEEGVLRRSTRVRAQPRDKKAMAYLSYDNKWREK